MKLRYLLGALAVAMLPLSSSAQDEEPESSWFIQGGLGASYSVGGGAGLGEMLSPAGQVAFGRHFNPYIGARVTAGGWRGRLHRDHSTCTGFYDYHFTADGLWNIIRTFNHEFTGRVNLRLIAGLGFDRAFERPSSSLLVRLGLSMDVRLCSAIDFNLEYQANGVSDRWNGKDDHGFDSFMNLLVGATYRFGTGYRCKSCVTEAPLEELNRRTNEMRQVQEVEKIVRDTVEVIKEVPVTVKSLTRTVFYAINQVEVPEAQVKEVEAIANYLKNNKEGVASIIGYADKGTGTAAINVRLAKQRADNVASMLEKTFGIPASRLQVSSMLNERTEQPFAQNDLNRVVIMTANPK